MGNEPDVSAGSLDRNYNVLCFTEQCLSNVARLEDYAEDADRRGDAPLAAFFRRAQRASERGAARGEALLVERLRG